MKNENDTWIILILSKFISNGTKKSNSKISTIQNLSCTSIEADKECVRSNCWTKLSKNILQKFVAYFFSKDKFNKINELN